ncbi:hypothetical protein AAZV13_19G051700 [Glycine max]
MGSKTWIFLRRVFLTDTIPLRVLHTKFLRFGATITLKMSFQKKSRNSTGECLELFPYSSLSHGILILPCTPHPSSEYFNTTLSWSGNILKGIPRNCWASCSEKMLLISVSFQHLLSWSW